MVEAAVRRVNKVLLEKEGAVLFQRQGPGRHKGTMSRQGGLTRLAPPPRFTGEAWRGGCRSAQIINQKAETIVKGQSQPGGLADFATINLSGNFSCQPTFPGAAPRKVKCGRKKRDKRNESLECVQGPGSKRPSVPLTGDVTQASDGPGWVCKFGYSERQVNWTTDFPMQLSRPGMQGNQ